MSSSIGNEDYGLVLYSTAIESPLGRILAIASEKALYRLVFTNKENFGSEKLRIRWSAMIPEKNLILENIERELQQYFEGKLFEFKTPIELKGTDFQIQTWKTLKKIPYGTKITYKEEAEQMGQPKSFRAVANANGSNPLPIVIPCHRVVSQGNKLGGYSSGLEKKIFLLELEQKYLASGNGKELKND